MSKRKNNKKANNKQRKRDKKNSANLALALENDANTALDQNNEQIQEDDTNSVFSIVGRKGSDNRGTPFREGEPAADVPERATPEVLARRHILPVFRRIGKRDASPAADAEGSNSTRTQGQKLQQQSDAGGGFDLQALQRLVQAHYKHPTYSAGTSQMQANRVQEEDLSLLAELRQLAATHPHIKALLSVVSEKKSPDPVQISQVETGQHVGRHSPESVHYEQPSPKDVILEPISLLGLSNTCTDAVSMRRQREQEERLVALHVLPLEYLYPDRSVASTGARKRSESKGVSQYTSYTPDLDILSRITGASKRSWNAGVDPNTSYAGDVMLFPVVDTVFKKFHLGSLIIANCDIPKDLAGQNLEVQRDLQIAARSADFNAIAPSTLLVISASPPDFSAVAPLKPPENPVSLASRLHPTLQASVEPKAASSTRKAFGVNLLPVAYTADREDDKSIAPHSINSPPARQSQAKKSTAAPKTPITVAVPKVPNLPNITLVPTPDTPWKSLSLHKTQLSSTVASTDMPKSDTSLRKTVRFGAVPWQAIQEAPPMGDIEAPANDIDPAPAPYHKPDAHFLNPPSPQQQEFRPTSPSPVRQAFEAHNMPNNISELELIAGLLARHLNISQEPSFLDMRGGFLRDPEDYGGMK